MSDGSWDEVLKDYRYAQNDGWREIYIWMEKLVLHLLENRDLSMLYPITSHNVLSAFIGKEFSEFYHKPTISIKLTHETRARLEDKYRFKFSLNTGFEDGEIFRGNEESIYCSFENSLEVFDELFRKLKGATTTNLTIYKKTDEIDN